MPRFHFDVRLGTEPWFADEDGVVLKSLDEARQAAVSLALSLAQESHPAEELEVRVRDSAPEPLCGVRLTLERWTRQLGSAAALLVALVSGHPPPVSAWEGVAGSGPRVAATWPRRA
jgi:hypothetical protein